MMTGEITKNGVLQDLDEDVVITLTAKNPQAPQNIIRFDHTIGEYVTVKLAESMIDHLEIESTSIHKDSDEGQKQLMNEGKKQDGKREKTPFLKTFSYCKIHFGFSLPDWIFFCQYYSKIYFEISTLVLKTDDFSPSKFFFWMFITQNLSKR